MGRGFLKKWMHKCNVYDRIIWFNSKEYWLKESVIKRYNIIMRELYAMKVARTVLRGGKFSNRSTYLNRPYAALL